MSAFSESEQKCEQKQLETPCDIYLCFTELRHENAKQPFSFTRFFGMSPKPSPCETFTHWAVQVCYDEDQMFLCEANEEGGKLKATIRPWSKNEETVRKLLKPKVHLGQHSIKKERLMDIVADLNNGEDYNMDTNNCQHWAKKLLKKLDIDFMNHLTPETIETTPTPLRQDNASCQDKDLVNKETETEN